MDNYKTSQIRNVVFLGHGGSGKTTLAEAMAYVTGTIARQGKVSEGNTLSDFDKEEIKRKFSVNSSVIPIEWDNLKINILDSPGYHDFVGQMEEAVSVADAAVIVIDGKSGVESGTIRAWDICESRKIPRIFFVTGMDDSHANYAKVISQLSDLYGKRIAPFHLPLYENESFTGFVNVVKMGGRKFKTDGTYIDYDIPDEVSDELMECRNMILEAVAETDDRLMEKYFSGDEFTQDEISGALRKKVIDCTIVPVQIGSGANTYGTNMLLQSISKYFPSPDKSLVYKKGKNLLNGEDIEADKDNDKPVSAYVFKTIMDPFIGKYSLVKVCTGVLHNNDVVYNATKDVTEKLSKLYIIRGKSVIEVDKLCSGDIGAIGKLTSTRTGDTLSCKEYPVEYHATQMSKPYTYFSYKSKVKGEEDKAAAGLLKLTIEDLTLKVINDEENKQMLIYGIGEQQIDVAVCKLFEKFKVEIELSKPRVAYKETIRKASQVEGKHKKQSGGHGQYGHVVMKFEPSGDLDKSFVFEENIFGGSVPKNFFPAIEKGIAEGVLKGPLAGYPVVGIKAVLLDGSYHPVDSSEMAFKTATGLALKKGILESDPILLEPIAKLEVTVPDRFMGDVISDLNRKRGRVLGMNPGENGKQIIIAEIPYSQINCYSTDLNSITASFGEYRYEFDKYVPASDDIVNHEKKKYESRL